MTTLRKFVDGLAEQLGVSDEARKKWWQRRRGVPLRWRRDLITLAAQKHGIAVDWDELDEGQALERTVRVQNVPGNASGNSQGACATLGGEA